MNTRDKIVLTQILIAVIGLAATAYGTRVNLPDNMHIKYGLPFEWGVHTVVTIAGPASIWRVNVNSLLLDFALWFFLIIAAGLFMGRDQKVL